MYTEGFDPTGQQMAANAIAAEGALNQMKMQQDTDWTTFPGVTARRGNAMRGLAFAIPVALSFWVAIGTLVWLLARG